MPEFHNRNSKADKLNRILRKERSRGH